MKRKAKIVIASVLKPVNDVRLYAKIGRSIASRIEAEITILGTECEQPPTDLQTAPWPSFNRLSLGRIRVQWVFWRQLRSFKPDLIIVCTHELLLVSVLFRLTNKTRLIYDIQEDYFKTLWHQRNYPVGLRHVMAVLIRWVEFICSPLIDGYFLAEAIYAKEISFVKNKALILENKSLEIPSGSNSKDTLKFVFTGTLSSYSRTVESIKLFIDLASKFTNASMTVIGHCPNESYLNLLKNYEDRVELISSKNPIPHSEIVDQIRSADIGIIGYLPNPINEYKMPTKLFEYITARLPYLVQNGSQWHEQGLELGGAIPIDFKNPNLSEIVNSISSEMNLSFSKNGFLWSEQEAELISFINNHLPQE